MNTEFRKQLNKQLSGLNYVSETDAELSLLPDTREMTFSQFFAPLIRERKAMTEIELQTARKFRKLKGFIDANMKRKRVYLIGKINIEILIAGTDLSGASLIIKTKAVET